jgi:hypothetical protein
MTLVRVIYNDDYSIAQMVIPDSDDDLRFHLPSPGQLYVDMDYDIYLENTLDNGLPDIQKLSDYVKSLK